MSEYDDWKQENDRWEAYLYPNGVLRNKLGITKAAKWHKMEREFVAARNNDLRPNTGLTTGNVGEELFAVHQYLFQDCYEWAGQPRNVWMSFPRVRGDVPAIGVALHQLLQFSPRARGCSGLDTNGEIPDAVFPACAGMFPQRLLACTGGIRFPHASGDVPKKIWNKRNTI